MICPMAVIVSMMMVAVMAIGIVGVVSAMVMGCMSGVNARIASECGNEGQAQCGYNCTPCSLSSQPCPKTVDRSALLRN